ncbi:hypothetical protein [Acaryochloris thomasi]|nr:hypothetical protein [Acaryochloris thomasi]
MLPVLMVGTVSFYVGNRAILEQANQVKRVGVLGPAEAEFLRERQLRLLGQMLMGTGLTALSAGAIAAGITGHFLQVVNRNSRSGEISHPTESKAEPFEIEQDANFQELHQDSQSTIKGTASDLNQSVVLTGGLRRILAIAGSARELAANIEKAHIPMQPSREPLTEQLSIDDPASDLSDIQTTFAEVTRNAQHIGDRTHRISEIISSIDDLAIQVNQVSINALIKSGREKAVDLEASLLTTEMLRSLTSDIVQKTTEVTPVVSKIKADISAVESGIELGTEKIAARVELPLETWGKSRQ